MKTNELTAPRNSVLPLRTRMVLLFLLAAASWLLLWMCNRYADSLRAGLARGDASPAGKAASSSEDWRVPATTATGAEAGPTTAVTGTEAGLTTAAPDAEAGPAAPAGDWRVPATGAAATGPAAALAEIDLLAALASEDRQFDARRAIARLQPYAQAGDPPVRSAAARVLAPLLAGLDLRARSAARESAEAARELAEAGDFSAAAALLDETLRGLPADAPWTQARGRAQLQAAADALTARREAALAALLSQVEESWRRNSEQPGGVHGEGARLAALLQQRDASFRAAAEARVLSLDADRSKKTAEQKRKESAQRVAWLGFFERLNAAAAEGDLDAAEKMCRLEPGDPLLASGGGVALPEKVLAGCLEEIGSLKRLQKAALEKARTEKRRVSLTLKPGQIEGQLDGIEGRHLQVALSGGARVKVKIEQVNADGYGSIFNPRELKALNLETAVWALRAHEQPAQAPEYLSRCYAGIKQAPPFHWAARMELEKFRRADQEVGRKIFELNEAVQSGKAELVRPALDAARAAIAVLEQFEPLSEARLKAVAAAEKIAGKAARARVVLQNGSQPNAAYAGLFTDQISQYTDSAGRTDVGVQFGLKLGAAGGLQRVLIRFDGLEAALGKARVTRATLELYQVDSPQSAGASAALFRLKRPWLPDAGTWLSFDSTKNAAAEWNAPGAGGEADAQPKEDAKITLDNRQNVWRAWDVTSYVQEVLAGKAQNHGFLLRVTNGEPDYHVRFYPESDLAARKDAALRPRLTLDIERE